MQNSVSLDLVLAPSDRVVARDIEGELILVPLSRGIGDIEDAIFTLNDTGRAIWDRLDGQRSLRDVAGELSALYEAPSSEIEQDVVGLTSELLRRSMLEMVASENR